MGRGSIGMAEEMGMRKDGGHRAGVQRQWYGSAGKIKSSVVRVPTGYVVGAFQAVADSDLFVPQSRTSITSRSARGSPSTGTCTFRRSATSL